MNGKDLETCGKMWTFACESGTLIFCKANGKPCVSVMWKEVLFCMWKGLQPNKTSGREVFWQVCCKKCEAITLME